MQPKLLTNETVIQKVEAGLRLFIFTNKRLIVQNVNDSESQYTTYDMISRPLLTAQVLTDEIGPKLKPLTILIALILVVVGTIWAAVSGGMDAVLASMFLLWLVGVPALALASVILAVIVALALKQKPKPVMLLQILMKDGTMFVNEYFESELTPQLRHLEHLLIESSLGQLDMAATVEDGSHNTPIREAKIPQQQTHLAFAHHDQPMHHALPELSLPKKSAKHVNKGYKFAIATLVFLLAGAIAYALSTKGGGSRVETYDGPTVVRTSSNSKCATVKSTSPYQADMDFCLSDFSSEDAWQSKISEFVRQREFSNHGSPEHYTVSVVYYEAQKASGNSLNVEATSADSLAAPIDIGPQSEQVAKATVETDESGLEHSVPPAGANTDEISASDTIARSKYVSNLFNEGGKTTLFRGKVGNLPTYYTLTLHKDLSVSGTYMYNKRKEVYRLQGTMNEDGTVDLTEFTGDKTTAHCELVPESDCYVGKMKNTDGRSFTMSMCGAN